MKYVAMILLVSCAAVCGLKDNVAFSNSMAASCIPAEATIGEIEHVRKLYLSQSGNMSRRRSIELIADSITSDRCFYSIDTRGFAETTAEGIIEHPSITVKEFLVALWNVLNR